MLKEAAVLAGGALIFSPLGIPILIHGLSGVVIGGAGLIVADAMLKQVGTLIQDSSSTAGQSEANQSEA